jgi:hypothetical protein
VRYTGIVLATKDLDEDTQLDVDHGGNICTITRNLISSAVTSAGRSGSASSDRSRGGLPTGGDPAPVLLPFRRPHLENEIAIAPVVVAVHHALADACFLLGDGEPTAATTPHGSCPAITPALR